MSIFLIIRTRSRPYAGDPHMSCQAHVRPRRPRSVLDAVHGEPPVQGEAAAARARRGMYYWTPEGRPILDGVAGLWCVNAGHGRKEIAEAVSQPDRGDGIRAAVPDGTPRRVRTRQRSGELAAEGHRPRVLHQLGLRIGGHGAQDRARLPPRPRRRHAHALHRARARLPRRRLRRHLGRRHGQQPQVLRRACCRASITCRIRTISRDNAYTRGQPDVGRAFRRRPRAHRRAARREQHRRGHRRAGRRLDGRADAAEGLPAAPARDLHEARHPADLRRGDHGIRPPRLAVRRAALRRACPT